jgi:hypothetical protein
MQEQPTVTAVETRVIFALEIIIFLFGGLIITAGMVMAGSTATQVGRVPGYGLGLTLVTAGVTTIVGGGAMHFHRRRIEDRDVEVAVIRKEIATICESIKSLGAQVQALTRIEEKKFDQLAGRRNSNGS